MKQRNIFSFTSVLSIQKQNKQIQQELSSSSGTLDVTKITRRQTQLFQPRSTLER